MLSGSSLVTGLDLLEIWVVYHGILVALTFLATCALFPAFPFAGWIP